MRLYTKLLSSLVLVISVANNSNAQHYLGVATGDYSLSIACTSTPWRISDGNEKIVVSLASFGVSVDNNLGTVDKLSDIGSSINGSSTSVFTNSGHKTFSMLVPIAEVRGPSIMICLDDDHQQSFAITTRLRAMNQFNNFDQSV